MLHNRFELKDESDISTLDRVDELLSGFHADCGDWKSYWQEAEYLFEQATGKKYRDLNLADEPEMVVQLTVDRGMAANVIRLYDYILEGKAECRLLDVLTKRQPEKILPSPDSSAVYGNRKHYPASEKEKEAFYPVYSLEEVTEPELKDRMWDITGLATYRGGRNSARPFVVTLCDLMRDAWRE